MMRHLFAWNWLVSMVLLSLFLQNYPAVATGPQHIISAAVEKTREKADVTQKSTMADSSDSRPVEAIVAELSDEQVRRMLIEELQKDAGQHAPVDDQKKPAAESFPGEKVRIRNYGFST